MGAIVRHSDVPWWLQLTWKVATIGMAAILVYAATQAASLLGSVVIGVMAVLFLLIGLFTMLGQQ